MWLQAVKLCQNRQFSTNFQPFKGRIAPEPDNVIRSYTLFIRVYTLRIRSYTGFLRFYAGFAGYPEALFHQIAHISSARSTSIGKFITPKNPAPSKNGI
jgi:hypothetical protein